MKKRINLSLFCIVLLITGLLGSTLAFAAGAVPSPTVTEDNDTVSIKKQLIFVNDAGSDVREPNITYTYEISSVDLSSANATVTDSTGVSGKVKSGVDAALPADPTAQIAFADTNAAITASANGTPVERFAEFTFDPTQFPGPGIYRYKITETSTNKAAVGVAAEGTYSDTRYLDVYVKKTSATDDTLMIYGYVMFDADADTSFDAATAATIEKKSSGFVNTSTTAGSFDGVDVYRTQDLIVTKTTTGVMADKANDFPVAITVTLPNTITGTVKYGVTLGGNATLTAATTSPDTAGAFILSGTNAYSGTVDNGSTITITGIPQGATAVLAESNNTPDSYKVKAGTSADGTDLLAETIVAAGGNATTTTAVTLSTTGNIYLTNTLETISPTGYVTRFAPYVLILAGGILLIFFGRTALGRTSKKR